MTRGRCAASLDHGYELIAEMSLEGRRRQTNKSINTHNNVIAEINKRRLNISDLFFEVSFAKSAMFTAGRASVGVARS